VVSTAGVTSNGGSPSSPVAIVQLTEAQLAGALLRVAGLTVLERAIKQLRRRGYRVLLLTTPALHQSHHIQPPPGTELLLEPDVGAALPRLQQQHPGAPVVPADVVRPGGGDIEGGMRVTDRATRRQAEDAIFATLLRGDLGLVARYLNKPVSFRITRYLLCRLPVTPNQVTMGAGLIGLAGAALIALGKVWSIPGGLFLAHVQSVLDGCDGELARVRFQQSAIGEWLDTIVDDALNLALITALGVGLYQLQGQRGYLIAGLVAAGLFLLYNVVAYRELVKQGEGGEVLKIRWWFARGQDLKATFAGGRRGPAAWVMALGRRDLFVFAWLVLGLIGLYPPILFWALVMGAANATAAVGQILSRWYRAA
jgi:phosphatidylglycerophosphate synthase